MRCASASLAAVALAACATSPPPLPPRRPVAEALVPTPPSLHPPDLDVRAEPPVVRENYMAQVMAADLVSVVPLIYWIGYPKRAYLPLPALVLSPIIHSAHGEAGKAVASLLMRGALVGVAYWAGRQIESECRGDNFLCVPLGPLFVVDLAFTAVMVTDAVVLAHSAHPDRKWRRLPVLPMAGGGARGLTFSASF